MGAVFAAAGTSIVDVALHGGGRCCQYPQNLLSNLLSVASNLVLNSALIMVIILLRTCFVTDQSGMRAVAV